MTSSSAADPNSQSQPPSDRLWLRSELMGTQVITRDSGRRLGVVGEVVVDIDRREVVALGLRDNPLTRFLPGLPRWMPLDRIRQVGDVILVDSADSLAEGFDPERYSKVINCQVVSESGVQLGRVLGFSFDIETGELTTLVIGALGVPLLGEGVLSTWELPVGEIVSSGTDRIVVYEGAEDKLRQLGTGLLEKLGIGGSSWEQEERERFRSTLVPAENQLPAGVATAQEQRRLQPSTSRALEPRAELEYVELEERAEREPLRQRRYLEEDQPERGGRGGWEETEPRDRYGSRQARGWDDEADERFDAAGRLERRDLDQGPEPQRWSEQRLDRRPEPRAGERGFTDPGRDRSERLRPMEPSDDAGPRRSGGWARERDGDRDREERSPRPWPDPRDDSRERERDDRRPFSSPEEPYPEPRRRAPSSQAAGRDTFDPPGSGQRPQADGEERRPLGREPFGEGPRPLTASRNDPRRSSADAGPRPATSAKEPVDVEPEVLDDPW